MYSLQQNPLPLYQSERLSGVPNFLFSIAVSIKTVIQLCASFTRERYATKLHLRPLNVHNLLVQTLLYTKEKILFVRHIRGGLHLAFSFHSKERQRNLLTKTKTFNNKGRHTSLPLRTKNRAASPAGLVAL